MYHNMTRHTLYALKYQSDVINTETVHPLYNRNVRCYCMQSHDIAVAAPYNPNVIHTLNCVAHVPNVSNLVCASTTAHCTIVH
jgi:hypothetical protein